MLGNALPNHMVDQSILFRHQAEAASMPRMCNSLPKKNTSDGIFKNNNWVWFVIFKNVSEMPARFYHLIEKWRDDLAKIRNFMQFSK